jgi:hypothetical protein
MCSCLPSSWQIVVFGIHIHSLRIRIRVFFLDAVPDPTLFGKAARGGGGPYSINMITSQHFQVSLDPDSDLQNVMSSSIF